MGKIRGGSSGQECSVLRDSCMCVSLKSKSSESGPGQWLLLIHFHSSSGHCDLNYKLDGEDVPYRWVGPTWRPSG